MPFFGRRRDYDRKRLLNDAREARRRGKHRRAIAYYRQILVVEPNSIEIHTLIASSLAASGLDFCAWESYQRASEACLDGGEMKLALDLLTDANARMPRHYGAWIATAALQRTMGRTPEARRTIKCALAHFRGRATRHERVSLLRLALELDPRDRAVELELAYALVKSGQKDEALVLLTRLAEASDGSFLRKVRRIQWNMTPSLSHSWLWLRSTISSICRLSRIP